MKSVLLNLIYGAMLIPLSYAYTDYTPCNFSPDPSMNHYIIGYESLINEEFKARIFPGAGPNIPVSVNEFTRAWSVRSSTDFPLGTTYLGVNADPGGVFNGVMFRLANSIIIEQYDERQRNYCRVSVQRSDVLIRRGTVYDDNIIPNNGELKESFFWIYVTNSEISITPDEKFPIVQSYVDIFLSGCIQIERKFGTNSYSDQCITQTRGWEYPWVNDRIHPRRPLEYQPYAGAIDKLIVKHIRKYYDNIYVEKIHILNNGTHDGPTGIRIVDVPIDEGVPIEFWYNQTAFISETNRSSVPGCPRAVKGSPWVYYGKPTKCFLTGFQGPCSIGGILVPREETPYGSCVCECLHNSSYPEPFVENTGRFIHCKAEGWKGLEETWNGQIYDRENMECHNIGRNETCSVIGGVGDTEYISCTNAGQFEDEVEYTTTENFVANLSGSNVTEPISDHDRPDYMTSSNKNALNQTSANE